MCNDEELRSAVDTYYFDGDFWPQQLEDSIKELEREEQEQRQLEEQEVGFLIGAYFGTLFLELG